MPQGHWPEQEPKQDKKKKEAHTTEKHGKQEEKKKEAHTTEKHDNAYHSAAEHINFHEEPTSPSLSSSDSSLDMASSEDESTSSRVSAIGQTSADEAPHSSGVDHGNGVVLS